MRQLQIRKVICLGALALLIGAGSASGQSRPKSHFKFLGKNATYWVGKLSDKDVKIQRSAAFALARMGTFAETANAVPKLVELVAAGTTDESVREAAAFALGDICQRSAVAPSTPGLFKALEDALKTSGDERVRRSCAYALGCMGQKAVNAVTNSLNKAAADDSPAVRQNAAWALGRVDPAGKSGVLTLANILKNEPSRKNPDPLVIRDAANSLAKQGADAVPALKELAKYYSAAGPFSKVQPKPRTAALVEMRKSVIGALAELAANADDKKRRPAIVALQNALDDANKEIKINAAIGLANIGKEHATPAIPTLVGILKDYDASMQLRIQVATAFRNIGIEGAKGIPILRELAKGDKLRGSKSEIEKLRLGAVSALGGVYAQDKDSVNLLVNILGNSKDPMIVRKFAAHSLTDIGGEDSQATRDIMKQVTAVVADKSVPSPVRAYGLQSMFIHGPTAIKEGWYEKVGLDKVMTEIVSKEAKQTNDPTHNLLRYQSAALLAFINQVDASDATMKTLVDFVKDNTLRNLEGTKGKGGRTGEGTNKDKSKVGLQGGGDGRTLAINALRIIGVGKVSKYPEIKAQLDMLRKDENAPKAFVKKIDEMYKQFGW